MSVSTSNWDRSRKTKRYKGDVDANDISIEAIVAHYGGQVRQGKDVSVKCIMHNDSRASASMNTYDNLYFCFTCGKGGNAANLVCILENLEFKDGLKRAIEIAAGSGAAIRSGNKSRGNRRATRTWDI
jgi:DNA primase